MEGQEAETDLEGFEGFSAQLIDFEGLEGEEEGLFDEKSDSITGMSAAEKKKHQIEYVRLLKEINAQNKIVNDVKETLLKKCEKSCLTKCEIREIKNMRACMEQENLKLQCMVQKAIKMQNELPSKCWGEVPIVPTLEDDVFPRMGNASVMTALGLMPCGPARKEDQDVCDVCMKKKKKKPNICDDDEVMDSETCRMFEAMAAKDKLIKALAKKLKILEQEHICASKKKRMQKTRDLDRRATSATDELEDTIAQMQCTVDMLKKELKSLCKEKKEYDERKSRQKICEPQVCEKPMSAGKKENDLQKLREDYAQLLACYTKKEAQLKELEKRSKGYCIGTGGSPGKNESVDYAELKLLRDKVTDLRDEQEEYTCIIKEQAEQLDDYRRKYIDAQQKVEEQKCMLEKIDMNNKRIEGQIEAEVKRIKTKFKEQLSALSQYPKLLENEQIKLVTACKQKEDLEGKLRLVCKELRAVKDQLILRNDKPDNTEKLAECQQELLLVQSKLEDLQKEKDLVCDELLKAKFDLDTMRAESAKIITTTKERFETTKTTLCLRIDTLEREIAQCRASAYLSISDREAVIKEMQGQLSTLSYSFDSAQKQIKTLKNHISFLSNDQCIPIKC